MQNPPLIRPDMQTQGNNSMTAYSTSERSANEQSSPHTVQSSTAQKLPHKLNHTTNNNDTDVSVVNNSTQPPLPNLLHLPGPPDYRSMHQNPMHPSYVIPPHSNERKQSASYNKPPNAHVNMQSSMVFPPKNYPVAYPPHQITPPLTNGLPNNKNVTANKDYIIEGQPPYFSSRNTSITSVPLHFENSVANLAASTSVSEPPVDREVLPAGSSGKTLRNTRRAAQNRTAQKAFRQRKEKYIKTLEQKSKIFDDLLAENNYFKSLNDTLRNDNNILISQHEAIRNAITMLRGEYDALFNENNMLKNESNILKNENNIIKNEHNMSRNENENLKIENKRFHAEYIRMIEDIEITRRREQEQRNEREQLIKKIRSLEDILKNQSSKGT